MKTSQKLILDQKTIGIITTFENITKTSVVEFFQKNNQLVFIVKEGQASQAIGKAGSNVKKLFRMFKKNIRVIEFSKDPKRFLQNLINPIKPGSIKEDNNELTIKAKNTQDKAILLGRDRNNSKFLNNLMKKYHKLNVKVE